VLLLLLTTVVLLSGTALSAEARTTVRGPYLVLAPGDSGARVERLQRYLHVRPVSGYYGSITRRAVGNWQVRHGRARTGRVGHYMWGVITAPARRVTVSRSGSRVDALNWTALARCEASNNPRAVNPAGYYGLYQFDVSTWRSVGGSGMPNNASAAEQTRRAKILYSRRGSSPWPTCGRLLYS
jgi:hypothetical protein